MKTMKLLMFSWNANNEQVLADNLRKAGFELVIYDKPCKHYTRDIELASDMIPFIHAQGVESVISFNYFPILSMICHTCRIPYFSWVYDCPHFTLYAKQIILPCNHIGLFDREMVKRLQEAYRIPTVFHAPLAVDTGYFEKVIRTKNKTAEKAFAKYECDVSFVGSLYTDEHNYYDILNIEKADHSEETESPARLITRQCFAYKEDYLRSAIASKEIDTDVIKGRMGEKGFMLGEDYFALPEDILLAAVLEKKVTVEERRILLTQIAEDSCADNPFSFKLYSNSNTNELSILNAANMGAVDYHTQMPLVFAASRINLNISLRSIHSGIPLRVLDIMACGGFVLSNWQPELAEYFIEGEEVALFESKEECMEKIAYYLAHEDKRKEIAAAGRQKVKERFSYERGLERLFGV